MSLLEALERLYERAAILQDQLDEFHKSSQLLLEVLEVAVQDHSFYCYLDRLFVEQYSSAFHQNFHLVIQKRQRKMRSSSMARISSAFPAITHNETPYPSNSIISPESALPNGSFALNISEALFAEAGLRCVSNIQKDQNQRWNPKDCDRNINLCRGCNSPSHFIRNCDKIKN